MIPNNYSDIFKNYYNTKYKSKSGTLLSRRSAVNFLQQSQNDDTGNEFITAINNLPPTIQPLNKISTPRPPKPLEINRKFRYKYDIKPLNEDRLNLSDKLNDLRGLVSDLTRERELIMEENRKLRKENIESETKLQKLLKQESEQNEKINQLRNENRSLKETQSQNANVFNCPVCYEVNTPQRKMVVLFCGHILCQMCRRGIERSQNSQQCPTCRTCEVNAYIELFV